MTLAALMLCVGAWSQRHGETILAIFVTVLLMTGWHKRFHRPRRYVWRKPRP